MARLVRRLYDSGGYNANNVGRYTTLDQPDYFGVWSQVGASLRILLRNGVSHVPLAQFGKGDYSALLAYYTPTLVLEGCIVLMGIIVLVTAVLGYCGIPRHRGSEYGHLSRMIAWAGLATFLACMW